jgi:predicted nicotinamide N-methyase
MERRAFILENTRIASPMLCPEIQLHLITEACPLWRATERDLAEIAIGDPYWGFCWAGGQALARYILDNPERVTGKRVFDFGAGCGVEAVAAMHCGASRVLASDIDPFATEAMQLNALLNRVTVETTTMDLIGETLPDFDVALAGDMFYDPDFSRRSLAWLTSLASRGLDVFLADPGRGNLCGKAALKALASYQAPADVDLEGKYLQQATVYTIDCRNGRESDLF